MNMKFIRKARRIQIRDRAFDLLTKALLVGVSVLACLWMISGAHAGVGSSITAIKTEQQQDGSYAIDFALSQKVSKEDVSVEYERNFIQISLKGVSAYPARTENINQSVLEKVFTYQYQPDLARARVLLKSAASTVKGKTNWAITEQGLRVTVKVPGAVAATDSIKGKAAAASELQTDTDEERIVQEILNEKNVPAATASAAKVKSSEEMPITGNTAAAPVKTTEDQALFSAKTEAPKSHETSAMRIIASLLLVIGIIGATAVGFRRFAMGKGLPFQRQAKIIDIIANQSLGPKRSIALVKVLDQFMVVGMSGDGMTLLANLGTDVKIDQYLDQIGGPSGSSFTDTFESALAGVTAAGKTDTAGAPITHKVAAANTSIRNSIKKRMEGFKPL